VIAIDARYVRERPSGIGAMVEAVVRRVPALMPDVQFLLLRHPRASGPLSPSANVREVVVKAEANGPGTLLALPSIVDLRGVRLFHATFNILPARLPMRTVATIHDVMWLTHPELCRSAGVRGRVEGAFYANGIRRALRDATRIIAVSAATRAEIAALDAAAGRRTTVIHHGLDPAFRPARDPGELAAVEAARARHVPGARRYVLTVGQAAGYKNQAAALEGFLRAFGGDPSVHLVLVQRLGEGARALLSAATAAGADGRVHVLPTVPFDDLLALYRGALCLCHPSLVEGWGMPVGEALGAGCPVVASDRSAMPEVLGGAGLLADPNDPDAIAAALRRLADDGSLRQHLIDAGLARARSLTWEAHAASTAALYREVLLGVEG
jgi:glycosyltransferase involved in cell wall biosynthesis